MAECREVMQPRYANVYEKLHNKTVLSPEISVNPAQMYISTGGALDWKERNPRFAEFVEAVREYRAEHPEVPYREVLQIVKKSR